MPRNTLGRAGIISALLFAVASTVVIDRWAYPQAVKTLGAFAAPGFVAPVPSEFRMALPFLTLAVAQGLGATALFHPRLTSKGRRGVLAGAILIGWLLVLVLFVPPDLVSWLTFAVPAGLLQAASWVCALTSLWLTGRLRS